MLKRLNLKEILFFVMIVIGSFSLSRVGVLGIRTVFIIPFILFNFMLGKKEGVISYIVSFINLVMIDWWYLLFYLVIFMFLFSVNRFSTSNRCKLEYVLSIFCLCITLIEGIIFKIDILLSIFCGLISYWCMRYFYDFFINIMGCEVRVFSSKICVFILGVLGLTFLGLKLNFFGVDLSFVLLIFLAFIAGKISFGVGVLYTFLTFLFLFIDGYFYLELILFLLAFLISFLLDKTSKVTLVFTYAFLVVLGVYYFSLDYLVMVEYLLGSVLFIFVPREIIKGIKKRCIDNEGYISNLIKEYENKEKIISNKILKMEEIVSLFSLKLEKGRVRKNERELLLEEVKIVEKSLRDFSYEIRKNNEKEKLEREFYKYGFDLISCNISENVLKEKNILLNIRCEKRDIKKMINPLINKVFGFAFLLEDIKFNSVYDVYRLRFSEFKKMSFSFGVSQIAKEGNISGDSYLIFETKRKKIFALSDGMGSGEEAKRKSKKTLELLKKMMDLGFGEMQALKSINYILRNEDSKESYATLDLFVYDKEKDVCYFCKNGASDSYVFNEEGITVVEGNNLPIGIVDKIGLECKEIVLNDDNYVIMVSDGVKEEKIKYLKDFKNKEVNKIAREITGKNKEISDDESVIVIKIKKTKY